MNKAVGGRTLPHTEPRPAHLDTNVMEACEQHQLRTRPLLGKLVEHVHGEQRLIQAQIRLVEMQDALVHCALRGGEPEVLHCRLQEAQLVAAHAHAQLPPPVLIIALRLQRTPCMRLIMHDVGRVAQHGRECIARALQLA